MEDIGNFIGLIGFFINMAYQLYSIHKIKSCHFEKFSNCRIIANNIHFGNGVDQAPTKLIEEYLGIYLKLLLINGKINEKKFKKFKKLLK